MLYRRDESGSITAPWLLRVAGLEVSLTLRAAPAQLYAVTANVCGFPVWASESQPPLVSDHFKGELHFFFGVITNATTRSRHARPIMILRTSSQDAGSTM